MPRKCDQNLVLIFFIFLARCNKTFITIPGIIYFFLIQPKVTCLFFFSVKAKI